MSYCNNNKSSSSSCILLLQLLVLLVSTKNTFFTSAILTTTTNEGVVVQAATSLLRKAASSTTASHISGAGNNTTTTTTTARRRRRLQSGEGQQRLRRREGHQQLENNNMASAVLKDQIHTLLATALLRKSKRQEAAKVSFTTDNVSGVQLPQEGGRGRGTNTNDNNDKCNSQGKITFTTKKLLRGLLQGDDDNLLRVESIELVKGSQEEEVRSNDDSSSWGMVGYQVKGVWKVVIALNPFQLDLTSHVSAVVDDCDNGGTGTGTTTTTTTTATTTPAPLDVTHFGRITVKGRTMIKLYLQVQGKQLLSSSSSSSNTDFHIKSAQVLQQQVTFMNDTTSTSTTTSSSVIANLGGGLSRDHLVPLNNHYQEELESLVRIFLTRKLETITPPPHVSSTTKTKTKTIA